MSDKRKRMNKYFNIYCHYYKLKLSTGRTATNEKEEEEEKKHSSRAPKAHRGWGWARPSEIEIVRLSI